MRVEIPVGAVLLIALVLLLLDIFIVQIIYRFTRYKGFVPTLSEAALTDAGRIVYSYMTPLMGILTFFSIQLVASARAQVSPDEDKYVLVMRVLCLFTYLCLSYQAVVPFNKSRKLDSHTVMAGLCMTGASLLVLFNTYLGWWVYHLSEEIKRRCFMIRMLDLFLMMYCVARVMPFMFRVFRSPAFRESKVILRNDTKFLNRMGLLQLTALITMAIYMVSVYFESDGLYITVYDKANA